MTLRDRNNMPQLFTYEHFIQAAQSFKDDMLMYYVDEAVAIYCSQIGTYVSPALSVSKIIHGVLTSSLCSFVILPG
jgi:hypothetical protein